ncbi:tyrosine-type recombinase/integrase [Micromonospora sp. CPCC 205561]|uniref:tyrosine-type recombinase/integrase n=1 Tax=Micromonospora sp. CPCC 205561 TaxID=3122407 RepID=UPI002FF29938
MSSPSWLRNGVSGRQQQVAAHPAPGDGQDGPGPAGADRRPVWLDLLVGSARSGSFVPACADCLACHPVCRRPTRRGAGQGQSQGEQLRATAGLEWLHPHDLRHAFATFLLDQGEELRTVMELLGHSTIRMTADTYGHVLPARARQAASAIDRILGEEGTA